jgi:hypothetical protein
MRGGAFCAIVKVCHFQYGTSHEDGKEKMETITVQADKRPFAPAIIIALLLVSMIGLIPAGALYLAAGPQLGQAAWALARLAWRLIPPLLWAVVGAAAVFWLWLMRRLWRANGRR